MRFLLDTHTFLWWANEPKKLSKKALSVCKDLNNELLLSVVSVWEMQIKIQLGKLRLKISLADLINEQVNVNGIVILPIEIEHVFELNSLEDYHRDPFDRLLIAQSNVENLAILSKDPVISRYTKNVIW